MVDNDRQNQCRGGAEEQECRLALLPGPHVLLVWYEAPNARSKDARSFKLNMPEGRSYRIESSPVYTLDDWAVFVFNTSGKKWRLIYSDRDQHCKTCPPVR